MDLTFWLSAGFGALVLLVHGHQLFYDPNLKSTVGQGRFPILKGVALDRLSKPQTQTLGYVFYLFLYLAIYAIALAVFEFGEAALQAAGSTDQLGGQGAVPTRTDAEAILEGSGNARPLAIALAMIALLSARSQSGKTIRLLEAAVRNYAHRLAGIPNSIYSLITRLNRVDFAAAASDMEAPHVQTFEALRARVAPQVIEGAVMQKRLDMTSDNLRAIDTLAVSVLGHLEVFPVDATEPLAQLLKKQEKEYQALSQNLQTLAADRADALTPEQFRSLFDLSTNCLRNLKALFAVLYSQSDLDLINESHSPTAHVVSALRQPDKYRIVDKAVLAVSVTCFAFLSLYAVYAIAVWAISEGMGDLRDFFFNSFTFIARVASLLFFTIVTAIGVRRAAIDKEDWPEWSVDNAPVALLLRSSFWPAAAASAVATALLVLMNVGFVARQSGMMPSTETIMDIVLFETGYTGVYFPLAIVVSLASFIISDQHLNWSTLKTVTIGGAFAIPFAIVAAVGFLWLAPDGNAAMRRALNEAFMMGLFTLVALTLLAFFVERAETEDERSRGVA